MFSIFFSIFESVPHFFTFLLHQIFLNFSEFSILKLFHIFSFLEAYLAYLFDELIISLFLWCLLSRSLGLFNFLFQNLISILT